MLGFDPEETFVVADEVLEHTRRPSSAARRRTPSGRSAFDAWAAANPERKALLDRVLPGELPDGVADALPVFEAGKDVSTRAACGKVLTALGRGASPSSGAAPPTSPSRTTRRSRARRRSSRREHSTHEWTGNPYGRVLHFGIREHAMGAILNGIVLHGTDPRRSAARS